LYSQSIQTTVILALLIVLAKKAEAQDEGITNKNPLRN